MTNQTAFSGQSVDIPVSGIGPTNVSILISGHSGAFGYQPHGTVQLEYFSPVESRVVHETVVIGGGQGPTILTVATGSTIANEEWAGAIKITPIDNAGHVPGPLVSVFEKY